MSENIKTKFCAGVSDVSDTYMGFIIDQWGVLHDGNKIYTGVIECLKQLQERGKHVIILSNSGKRSSLNKDRLKKMGIGPSLYDTILTSGEMTFQGLEAQDQGFFKDIGKTCYVISRGGDLSIIEGLKNVDVVDNIADAEFLLISGSDAPEKTIEDYEPILKEASRKRLMALCANPDSLAIMGSQSVMGSGTIARRYQDFGGVVNYIGKPHKLIFQEGIRILQAKGIYPGQTIMIGDSMSHDILGASLVNIDSCLVRTGLHSAAFGSMTKLADIDRALNMLSKQYNDVHPRYLVDSFKWGNPLPDRKNKRRAVES